MWTRDFLYACICFLIALGLLVPCMLFRVGILSWLLGRELEQQDARLATGASQPAPAPAPAPAPVSDTEESFA